MDHLLFESQRPAGLAGVRELRHLLARVTQVTALPDSLRNRILLCFAEAATNIVEHATPKASLIRVRFGRGSFGYWLELLDDGDPWNPSEHETGDAFLQPGDAEGGLGIGLLLAQADRMHYSPGEGGALNGLTLEWLLEYRPSRLKVMIVEDELILRRVYQTYLANTYEVSQASSGLEALAMLKAAPVDLVLSDINMPEMDGLTLREHLAEDPTTELMPFVFLTGNEDEALVQRATSLGIDDYLVKPVSREQLLHSIDRVLGRSRQIINRLSERIDKRISSTLSPQPPEELSGWRLAVGSRNTGRGGGDLLFYRSNATRSLLVLADIMGHDATAKFFAYSYGGYLRGLMHAADLEAGPGLLLERLSQGALQDDLLSQAILTCMAAVVAPDGELSLVSAGHPPPLRISTQGVEPLPVGGVLPGILPGAVYRAETFRLGRGERIALYTDGLFESANDEAGRRDLEEGILAALRETLDDPPDRALVRVMALFDRIAGVPARDDALLLLLEPTGRG